VPRATYGILTGGGDCPGLNAVIRAVAKKLLRTSRVVGIADGLEGLIDDRVRELTFDSVSGILTRGGTILGTSNKGDPVSQAKKIMATYRKHRLSGIVAIGGDGTTKLCHDLAAHGARFVCVPKTIDNDVESTDVTFGFDTAVAVVAHALDSLHTTADAHRRIMVVEVMGRTTGWIALYGGVAGGADVILIPELPFDLAAVAAAVRERHRTRRFTIVVVAEGAGSGLQVAAALETATGIETRVTVLGHLQRGGTPTPADRILATRYGAAAADLVLAGRWNRMVALREGAMTSVPIAEVAGRRRAVPAGHELIRAAEEIGASFGKSP
jgi:6-phosphofructokinase 1